VSYTFISGTAVRNIRKQDEARLTAERQETEQLQKAIFWMDNFNVSAEASKTLPHPDMTIRDYVMMAERVPLPIHPDVGPSYTSKRRKVGGASASAPINSKFKEEPMPQGLKVRL
jgi:hypothetical protein